MYRYNTRSNQFSFRSDSPLTNDEILRHAPSVMAEAPHDSRGERYSFIPTIKVLDGLRDAGFQPFEVRQTRCRDEGKRDYTRHLVRMRHADMIGTKEEVPEIVLLNSHDGTSSYQLLAGIFRMVCSNGLIAGEVCNDIRIRHSGNVVDDVIEGSFTVLDNLENVVSRVDQYKAIPLLPQEQLLIADAAIKMRWDEDAPVTAADVLRPRRWEDRKDDLWTVTNRVQESLIRGGVSGRSKTNRRMHTRAVTGVNEDVRLNRALWGITDYFAQQKQAA
jgi:hypothetical protein